MKVIVENGQLTVSLGIKEKIWACKTGVIAVPLDAVRTVHRGIPGPRIVDIRAPGTFIPGVIKAGTYYTRAGKEFWYVTRGKRHYVTLELAEGAPYRRLVLGLDDDGPIAGRFGIGASADGADTRKAFA